jgi:hypothetical protein
MHPAKFPASLELYLMAVTEPDQIIVCVTDKMISFDDIHQASEDAAIKIWGVHADWIASFAANDVSVLWPVLRRVRANLAREVRYDLD